MTNTRLAPMIFALTVLLTGCAPGPSAAAAARQLQERYRTGPVIAAQAEVLADYGERAYAYSVNIQGSRDTGCLTVTAPEEIAGTGTAWRDGQTALDYEGISLETGPLSPDGLSPADGVPVVLTALAEGAVVEQGWTDWGEAKHCLYLLLENPATAGPDSRIAVWGDPATGALVHAEVLWQEKRVLSFTFADYVVESNKPE